MDDKIQLAKEVTPDTLFGSAKYGTTFIFTANNHLHTGELREMHVDLIHKPDIKAELLSLGVKNNNPGQYISSSTAAEQFALMGRVGFLSRPIKIKLPWDDDVPNIDANICSFWNKDRELLKKLLRPCLDALIKSHLLELEDIVVYPPYTLPRYVSDFFMAKKAKQDLNKAMNPEQQKKVDMWRNLHLMRGNEKKQAMASLGLGAPKSKISGLMPGQKSWATTSEALNFKEWFSKLTEH